MCIFHKKLNKLYSKTTTHTQGTHTQGTQTNDIDFDINKNLSYLTKRKNNTDPCVYVSSKLSCFNDLRKDLRYNEIVSIITINKIHNNNSHLLYNSYNMHNYHIYNLRNIPFNA